MGRVRGVESQYEPLRPAPPQWASPQLHPAAPAVKAPGGGVEVVGDEPPPCRLHTGEDRLIEPAADPVAAVLLSDCEPGEGEPASDPGVGGPRPDRPQDHPVPVVPRLALEGAEAIGETGDLASEPGDETPELGELDVAGELVIEPADLALGIVERRL